MPRTQRPVFEWLELRLFTLDVDLDRPEEDPSGAPSETRRAPVALRWHRRVVDVAVWVAAGLRPAVWSSFLVAPESHVASSRGWCVGPGCARRLRC